MQRTPLIAVVDDDAAMCDAIAEMLEVMDFDCVRFSGAAAFLGALAMARFDCLVSDVRMPGMDGFELARGTAALAPDLPILFVSSIDDATVRGRAARAGVRGFLRKPLDPIVFAQALDLALYPRRAVV